MTAAGDFHLADYIVFQRIGGEVRGMIYLRFDYGVPPFIFYEEYHKNGIGKIITKYCTWVDTKIDGMFVCANTYNFDKLFSSANKIVFESE